MCMYSANKELQTNKQTIYFQSVLKKTASKCWYTYQCQIENEDNLNFFAINHLYTGEKAKFVIQDVTYILPFSDTVL